MTDSDARHILIIGAHPDDCEIRCGGTAALWRQLGWPVTLLSLTAGCAGHHEMPRAALAARRRQEAADAAAVISAESRVLDIRDGEVEPTIALREKLIRALREIQPDVILTHRAGDYHPDHRYASQLVADASFLLSVPAVAPDAPPLRRTPAIFYYWDDFQRPVSFRADAAVDIDPVFETKVRQLTCHASQFFEWLPWLRGELDSVPADEAGRERWARDWMSRRHQPPVADACRPLLVQRYGAARADGVRHAEAFERCEYGAGVDDAELSRIFPF